MSNPFLSARRLLLGAWLCLPFMTASAADAPAKAPAQPVSVEITTNRGAITVELDPAKAPTTVANFLHYVNSGFYNGTIFHRVIPGFMIQGGGFTTGFVQKPTQAAIINEANNGLSNQRGTIAMARTSLPNSATSQFFINVADNKFLDYRSTTMQGAGYAVFGHVTHGMKVVDAIVNTPTGAGGPFPQDVPQQAVIIESIKVLH